MSRKRYKNRTREKNNLETSKKSRNCLDFWGGIDKKIGGSTS